CTPPSHTLRGEGLGDLVAVLGFLGVAVVVGSLFARTVAERQRTERRENDLRIVHRFATWLLRAHLDARTVGDVASTLVQTMRLRSCEIRVRDLPALSTTATTAGA